jgi:predicted N-acetyltransferase YhbS
MNRHSYQRSFTEDPLLSERVFTLLDEVFPEINLRKLADCGRKLGASWESVSTPFVKFDGDKAISHVGVLEIPMRLMGEDVVVGGIHAVSTHPEYRRRGFYRKIMSEVLDYCDSRYQTLVLTTSQPELYKPFGFRVLQEYLFTAKCNFSPGNLSKESARLLDINQDNDIQLLNRLLENRIPVSDTVGVRNEKAIFFVNQGLNSLYYLENLDTILVMEIEKKKLKLFDAVFTKKISLELILSQIPQLIEEVEMYFNGDSLDKDVEASPYIIDGDSLLMVRGKFIPEDKYFMLSPSTRC